MPIVAHVVGARPNFMKAAPVVAGLRKYSNIEQIFIHTGQHYDENMSEIFFKQLELPRPDVNLNVGSGSHAVQTAEIMVRLENLLNEIKPQLVLVYGDVNSTLAGALVCAKLLIPVAHVESGLRSFDRTMPEEINRILTDHISDLLFTTSVDANENLVREGIPSEKIFLVGNTMIDTLVKLLPKAESLWNGDKFILDGNEYLAKNYILVTLHRPSNVDNLEKLKDIVNILIDTSRDVSIIFPVHPRTRNNLNNLIKNLNLNHKLHFTEPLGYLEFLALQRQAKLVITDSGGVQEETTYLGVPCLTLRSNT
ncbi:MAG: UDP-N-acetylglucosamine 2-epimerase (non-hydrolyzing), partial [Candidatus Kryptonium sp.]|nr:UDP-N-acetylglucosamine 2-epimerase (non-hydrolyzing) [Candidatus Kryptonium sp.]